MTDHLRVNRPAPLKNVAAFSTLLSRVVERRIDLPGLGCFFGPSGLGKTKSAVYGANAYQAAYVECGQFTTARSLMISILKELGVQRPGGTISGMIDDAVMRLAADIRRPLIVDEAHHVAHKKFVDLVRELHDKSAAPIILIGEETLPKQLETFERVHNRILDWVAAVPCDRDDFNLLAKSSCPKFTIADDLAKALLADTRGNTRRLVVRLAKVEEIALANGVTNVDLQLFLESETLAGSSAPTPRGVAL